MEDSQGHSDSTSSSSPRALGSSRGSWLVTYQSWEIPYIWDDAIELLEPVIERYEEVMDQQGVFNALMDGEFQLWTSVDGTGDMEAALLTQIAQTRTGKQFCLIYAVAGTNLESWLEFLPVLEEWARQSACDELRIHGRRGWARVLGMNVHSTEMRKEL